MFKTHNLFFEQFSVFWVKYKIKIFWLLGHFWGLGPLNFDFQIKKKFSIFCPKSCFWLILGILGHFWNFRFFDFWVIFGVSTPKFWPSSQKKFSIFCPKSCFWPILGILGHFWNFRFFDLEVIFWGLDTKIIKFPIWRQG